MLGFCVRGTVLCLLSVHFNWALSALCRRVIENLSRGTTPPFAPPPPLRSLCPRKARNKFSNQQRTKQALCTINCAPLTSCSTSLQHILYPSGCDSENQEAACCCLFNKRLLAANTFNRMQFVDCGQSLHFPRFSTHPAKRPTLSTRN